MMSEPKEGISQELDELSSELLGEALDVLADVGSINVLLVVEAPDNSLLSVEFLEDSPQECLDAAHDKVRERAQNNQAQRYALVYEGAVMSESGSYEDALLLEFGEKGYRSYSAFCLVSGKGSGQDFAWTEPAPAGEIETLL